MKFENTEVWGFEHAFRGMRNPKNSWDKSDSYFNITDDYDEGILDVADAWVYQNYPELNGHEDTKEFFDLEDKYCNRLITEGILKESKDYQYRNNAFIGPNDMKLAQTLIKAGPEHRKFLRQIFVSVDITAPLYFFKQFDTYKIGTTANSTSTMHKLTSKPITLDCFEIDDWNPDLIYYNIPEYAGGPAENNINMFSDLIIEQLEFLRQKYLETKDKRYWKELVRWLPESWLQTRTFTCNYEILRNIIHQRKNHKLKYEWDSFIKWGKTLPYSKELIFYNNDYEKEYKLHDLLSQK